ncbi:MAG: transporter [Deltaproteobacteria bacterium]|nr:transporter [Deltaproteobacteria bacterium]
MNMKKFNFFVVLLSIGLFLSANLAYACDYCLLSQGISPLESLQGSGIRLNGRYSLLKQAYNGRHKIDNPGAQEEFQTTELTGFYGVSENLLLIVTLPYKRTRLKGDLLVDDAGNVSASTDRGRQQGLGDIPIMARYSFYKAHTLDSTTVIAGVWGIKLPTGKTDGRVEGGAEFLDSHLQIGTGSTDVLVGLSASHVAGPLSLSANLLGAITGDGKAGETDHRFGNTLNYDLTAKYRLYPGVVGPAGAQAFFALGLNGEVMDREVEGGVELRDSGGHKLFLTPGVQVSFAPHWSAEVSYHLPIYVNMNGTQLVEDYKVMGGVTYIF